MVRTLKAFMNAGDIPELKAESMQPCIILVQHHVYSENNNPIMEPPIPEPLPETKNTCISKGKDIPDYNTIISKCLDNLIGKVKTTPKITIAKQQSIILILTKEDTMEYIKVIKLSTNNNMTIHLQFNVGHNIPVTSNASIRYHVVNMTDYHICGIRSSIKCAKKSTLPTM